ncbi:MAG TPA: hypothetical protein VKU44_08045, partial [Terriglobia bacterium]|nr:hypothetical protein [Terriglobia bacterium]
TFIRDSPATVGVVPGDARISMAREAEAKQEQRFDLLAIDAFSGDAIPVHLLTREAFDLYLRQLEPTRGILAVHISNDAVDLRPVLLGLAESFHLTAVVVQSPGPVDGCQAAVWALMAISPEALAYPAIASAGLPLGDRINPVLWTDDYSNLFRALRY